MGIFSKLNPGSVEYTCKTIFKLYQKTQALPPGFSKQDVFRYILHSRYSLIKTIGEDDFDEIIEHCSDISGLIYICVIKENPYRDLKGAVKAIYEIAVFFYENAPSEGVQAAFALNEALRDLYKATGVTPDYRKYQKFCDEYIKEITLVANQVL